jgi:hypothetical protein
VAQTPIRRQRTDQQLRIGIESPRRLRHSMFRGFTAPRFAPTS